MLKSTLNPFSVQKSKPADATTRSPRQNKTTEHRGCGCENKQAAFLDFCNRRGEKHKTATPVNN